MFLNVGRRVFLGGKFKIADLKHCLNYVFYTLIFGALEAEKEKILQISKL